MKIKKYLNLRKNIQEKTGGKVMQNKHPGITKSREENL